MSAKKPGLFIGTSGWSYAYWKGDFYPSGLPAAEMLPFYARQFRTVELNSTFYRLPSESAIMAWKDGVPADFVFSVKASRFITHMKHLKDPAATLPPFFERMKLLGPKLGPILFQLPSRWHLDLQRLAEFLMFLDRNHRYAFEFRDQSWFDRQVFQILSDHQAAFCIHDLDGRLSPLQVTSDFVYLRLHGPDGPYSGCYDEAVLASWAERIAHWQAQGKAVYCYFDNDQLGYAVRNARALQAMRLPASHHPRRCRLG